MTNIIRFGLPALLACLLTNTAILAQSGGSVNSAEFDHTTVHVRDLQKTANFYEKVFAHQQLHVVGDAKEASASRDIEVHFAFRVPSIPDFTTHLDQMQVKYRSFDGSGKVTNRPDGVHQIYLQDPDGYWIEVNDNKF